MTPLKVCQADLSHLKSCLLSLPDGLPNLGLVLVLPLTGQPLMYHSHSMSLSFLICEIHTLIPIFIDSTNLLLWVLGPGDPETKVNETVPTVKDLRLNLGGETEEKSETHGEQSEHRSGSDQLS